ncbi:LytTR family two component transcriptional regulator [Algoriphagus aquaeductus]|uniref:LytTR family two component transcriptional regulator n=1 Tax=Algoriphagus aquaeductus TaxID=475299 RepID=A0A326RN05_9BACT|nr:LytTR family DNA-binding domain-containing protein [Algoriphagus aquaeductus]PZV79631.1 LytTR family two component transcriptional regulator [Algoriphagus aquaeductus]
MIRSVIIEDEKNSAERLRLLLERDHFAEVEVLAWLKTMDEAVTFLTGHEVDLVFLDVEIQDRTAFELLEKLPKIDFKIIFTTAHQEYALKAIKVSALDYLLKPIDAEELAEALGKVGKKSVQDEKKAILSLLQDWNPLRKLPEKLALPSVNGIEYVPISELIRCQADVNYTHFFLKDGRKITVAKTLKEFENQLRDHDFFRVHNSHLINLREVRFYHKGKGGTLQLQDGSEIEVASRRKEELMEALGKI